MTVALTAELLRELVAEARLAPSVHNIQPTRWRLLADDRLALVDDTGIRAPVADPAGHDVRVSHGAALEGMSLALNRRGLAIAEVAPADEALAAPLASLGMLALCERSVGDPLLDNVPHRMSWRSTLPRRRRTAQRRSGSHRRAMMSSSSAIADRLRTSRHGLKRRNFPS